MSSNPAHLDRPSRLTGELRLFLTALQYFTRLPVPAWVGHGAEQLNGSSRYFTSVGALVGALGALILWASSLVLPSPLPAMLATAATILFTGAFHEDGLADTFDGLGGGATRERALEIMKDSRVGTFGIVALVLTLAIKVAALSGLPIVFAVIVLTAGHALSRAFAISLLFVSNYVGAAEHSRAKPVAQKMSGTEFLFAAVIGIIPLAWCGIHAVAGVLCALLVLFVLARWFIRRLGGFTGDTLGATQQLTEIAFYLGVLASWKSI